MLRTANCRRWLLILAGLVLLPLPARAQGTWDPGPSDPILPLPLGPDRPASGGLFTGLEFLYMHQTRDLAHQYIAYRGLIDSDGTITGLPGTYIGSGQVALSADDVGRTTFTPGFNVFAGYRFADGVTVTVDYRHLEDVHYTAGATLVPPYFRTRTDLADTYLTSAVYNFNSAYAGAVNKTSFPQSAVYGIWNGAADETILFTQRYNDASITGRIPVFDTEYSRTYGLAGGRWASIWERFRWRTVSEELDGNTNGEDVAIYSNIVSNQMYGGFVGCGTECYLGKNFALSLDGTAAGLLDFVKERAKYELSDRSTEAKRGRSEWTFVPELTAQLNLWWYPTEGIQVRLGYSGMAFFNTIASHEPVSFNVGGIDPPYVHEVIRIFHGLNVGISFTF